MRHEFLIWSAAAAVSVVVHAGIMAATAQIRIEPREDLRRAEVVLGDETLQTLTVNAQPVKPDAALDAAPVTKALAPAAQTSGQMQVASVPAPEVAAETAGEPVAPEAAPGALPTGAAPLDTVPAEAMAPEPDVAVLVAALVPEDASPAPAAPEAETAAQAESLVPAAPNPLTGAGEAVTLAPSGPDRSAAIDVGGQQPALAPALPSASIPAAATAKPAEIDHGGPALARAAPGSMPPAAPVVTTPATPADTVAVAETGEWTTLAPSQSWEIAAALPSTPSAGEAQSAGLAPLAPQGASAVPVTEWPTARPASPAPPGQVLTEAANPVAVASPEPQTALLSAVNSTTPVSPAAGLPSAALPSAALPSGAAAGGSSQVLPAGQPAQAVGPAPVALLPAAPQTAVTGTGVARVARAGALQPGGGMPAPAAPLAPSAPALAAVDADAPDGGRPASSGQRTAALTTPMVSQADLIKGFLKAYEARDCFFARPQAMDAAQPVLEGLRDERQAMDEFEAAFRQSVGVAPDLAMKPVMDAQCPAVNFIRNVMAKSDPSLHIDLDKADIADGSFLAGHLTGKIGDHVTLLLVDDDGAVRDISSEFHRKADGSNFFFIGEIRLLAEGRSRSQLILAITTDATLDLKIARQPGEALGVFQSISDQASAEDMSLAAAYRVFTVN